jgi:hypothetical protein
MRLLVVAGVAFLILALSGNLALLSLGPSVHRKVAFLATPRARDLLVRAEASAAEAAETKGVF